MTRFFGPGGLQLQQRSETEAVRQALAHAGLGLDGRDLQSIYLALGDDCDGPVRPALQWAGMPRASLVRVGERGPLGNSGAAALYLACGAVEAGSVECAVAVAVDRQLPGLHEQGDATLAMFGNAALEYQRRHGLRRETLAMIAVKAREHARHNPYALFATPVTLDEVLASGAAFSLLTRSQCAVSAGGSAAVIVCSDDFARSRGLMPSVHVAAQALISCIPAVGAIEASGYASNVEAARQAYEASGVGPDDIGVCELHDCCTANELLLYEALGFCREGQAQAFVEDGDNSHGGRIVVNPSGGLLARGHAPAATGLAQCAELVWQLRGQAGRRQVEHARMALQHSQTLDGSSMVTLYSRA